MSLTIWIANYPTGGTLAATVKRMDQLKYFVPGDGSWQTAPDWNAKRIPLTEGAGERLRFYESASIVNMGSPGLVQMLVHTEVPGDFGGFAPGACVGGKETTVLNSSEVSPGGGGDGAGWTQDEIDLVVSRSSQMVAAQVVLDAPLTRDGRTLRLNPGQDYVGGNEQPEWSIDGERDLTTATALRIWLGPLDGPIAWALGSLTVVTGGTDVTQVVTAQIPRAETAKLQQYARHRGRFILEARWPDVAGQDNVVWKQLLDGELFVGPGYTSIQS